MLKIVTENTPMVTRCSADAGDAKAITQSAVRSITLRLVGDLIGPWVRELERASDEALASGARLTVDIREVAFADRDGCELLGRLRDRGAAVAHASPFLAERLKSRPPAMPLRASAGDADLVDALRRGEPGAVEVLMERFAATAFRVAHGITKNAADAEEVVQDVFATIVRKIDTFEGRSALSTWVYRVAANAALNKRRGSARELEVLLETELPAWKPDEHRDGDPAFLLADWSQRPDEVLLSKEGRAMIRAALERLPDDYRAVVVLRDVEELSTEQVAETLGESAGAVKSRLHRARMALREQLTRAYAGAATAAVAAARPA